MCNSQEDFYEFVLHEGHDKNSVNNQILQISAADPDDSSTKMCIKYPPFDFLEKFPLYPTYDERWYMLERGVDFNSFEENNIPSLANSFAFEKELVKALNGPACMRTKQVYMEVMKIGH